MGIYSRYLYPRLTRFMNRFVGSDPRNLAIFEEQLGRIQGVVLEIGIGTGEILGAFDANKVSKVYGLDPTQKMIEMSEAGAEQARQRGIEVELLLAGAEAIPLPGDSVDTIHSSFTLCTIPKLADALKEMRRVLKSDGSLVFWDHGLHDDPAMQQRQRRGEPLHMWMFQGCHMTRQIPDAIREAGFEIIEMKQTAVAKIPETWGYSWYGRATIS